MQNLQYKKNDFIALATNTTDYTDYSCPACSFCRQYLWDNTHPDLLLIDVRPDDSISLAMPLKLTYLLPWPKILKPRLREQNDPI